MIQNELNKSYQRASCLPDRGALMAAETRNGVALEDSQTEACRKVDRSVAFMTQHVNKPLQVATLAAMANVSPSHFFALFKRRMGCPPMDYFTRLRMRRACELFDSTSASVKEVAAMLGYDDPFYFSRVFKSVLAIAPVRYRNLQPELRREARGQIVQERNECFLSGYTPRRAETGYPLTRDSQLVNRV